MWQCLARYACSLGSLGATHALVCSERAHALASKYQNLPLGLADALVITCAEHRGGLVMSLDKHFWVVAGEGKIQVLGQ